MERYGQPPVNPPEDNSQECGTCNGAGDYVLYEYGRVTHDGTCDGCGGAGRIEVEREEFPPLPDNWMDLI